MTPEELSKELDVIYENINKNGAPGLDGYEKSVIFTHAQDILVRTILEQDPSAASLSQLITLFEDTTGTPTGFSWGTVFNLPETGVLRVLNEKVSDTDGNDYTIDQISSQEFDIKQSKPYHYPRRRTAWRLPLEDSAIAVELFGRPNIVFDTYKLRYVRKPKPIIVENLKTISPFNTDMVDNYTITSGGTGYSVGDKISITGTNSNAVFQVTEVNAGVITDLSLIVRGAGITAGLNSTTRIYPLVPANTTATITVTIVSADTIDGEYLPRTSELDISLHREIVKIAATLAEQYYYDKYGTSGDQRQN
jgi:hypothetical protein